MIGTRNSRRRSARSLATITTTKLFFLCASIGLCGLPTPALATEAGEVVSRLINQGSYYDFLVYHLYTHTGHDRGPTGDEHDLCRDEMITIFTGYGLDVEVQEFGSATSPDHNVIATQYGTVDPSVQYIVGAHYDSADNAGADDDASGVAGLLELARVLSQFETAYTIKYIAFDREEAGLLGSEYYVETHLSDDIRGMIQLDMIAFDPDDLFRARLHSYDESAPLQSALASAFTEYSPLIYTVQSPGMCRSDHCPFEQAGFQGCLVIEDALEDNPCYHRECDSVETPDYIKYEYATEIVRGIAGYLADHADASIPFNCTSDCSITDDCNVDCDANGLCDLCELACMNAGDCDGNGLLDSCELADGNLDCNGNGVLDACDLAHGIGDDCNLNLVPDACEVAADPSIDCNGNGIPDECDIESGVSTDCNDNGMPDECEIADDPSLDCDGNGLLDLCETSPQITLELGRSSVHWDSGYGLPIDLPMPARSDVTIRFETRGDLRHETTWAEVNLGGRTVVGTVFENAWDSCDDYETDEIVVPASLFNELTANGRQYLYVTGRRENTDYPTCGSWPVVYTTIEYAGVVLENDCNENEILDICEINDGVVPDCNANDIPDSCDIVSGFSEDCDGNGIPDACDLAADPSLDCDGGGILDFCDVTAPYTSSATSGGLVVIGGSFQYYLTSAPLAQSDVVFRVFTAGNLCHEGVWAEVQINGVPMGNLFETSWDSCSLGVSEELLIPMDLFNAAAQTGAFIEVFYRCDSCDFTPCTSSLIRMYTSYLVIDRSIDCDEDMVPDECQLAADPSLDCDGNGTLDFCDVTKTTSINAGSQNIAIGSNSTFSLPTDPPSLSDVTLRFATRGDLRHDGNWAEVQLNGVVLGTVHDFTWGNCYGWTPDLLVVPMDQYNAAAQTGSIQIDVSYKSDSSDYTPCDSYSAINLRAEYLTFGGSADCNANGIPDDCDLADGTSEDCNANGVPDECQPDACGPQPNPMQFEPGGEPHGISTSEIAMTAVEAHDASGVEYQFRLAQESLNLPWTADRYFAHSGLTANTLRSYLVRVRDMSPSNFRTAFSEELSGATFIETPTSVEVSDITDTSATLEALGTFTNVDLGDSGFFFELYPPDGIGANEWLTTDSVAVVYVSDLVPGTSYKVRAKARNQMAQETAYTEWVHFRTSGNNPCSVCGDLDGDDDVDLADHQAFIDAFRSTSDDARFNLCADFDDDGTITARDFRQFVRCYREANPDAPMPKLPATPATGPIGPSNVRPATLQRQ